MRCTSPSQLPRSVRPSRCPGRRIEGPGQEHARRRGAVGGLCRDTPARPPLAQSKTRCRPSGVHVNKSTSPVHEQARERRAVQVVEPETDFRQAAAPLPPVGGRQARRAHWARSSCTSAGSGATCPRRSTVTSADSPERAAGPDTQASVPVAAIANWPAPVTSPEWPAVSACATAVKHCHRRAPNLQPLGVERHRVQHASSQERPMARCRHVPRIRRVREQRVSGLRSEAAARSPPRRPTSRLVSAPCRAVPARPGGGTAACASVRPRPPS